MKCFNSPPTSCLPTSAALGFTHDFTHDMPCRQEWSSGHDMSPSRRAPFPLPSASPRTAFCLCLRGGGAKCSRDHGTILMLAKHAPARGRAVWTCQHCIIHVPMQSQMHKRIAATCTDGSPWSPGRCNWDCWPARAARAARS
jgi:hypothetical protein